MPRKAREVYPDATYHITSRCHNRMNWLKLDKYKIVFLSCIVRAQKKYTFKLLQYTIMDNHFHLIIKTEHCEASISIIMQYIKSLFAQIYNRMNSQTGPFWNERFASSIIETAKNNWRYFMNVTMYVGYNPVFAGMVKNPLDYKYSSFRVYFDAYYKLPVRIDFHNAYLSTGNSFNERKRFMQQYEKSYLLQIGRTH